jgi:hypothetical protein
MCTEVLHVWTLKVWKMLTLSGDLCCSGYINLTGGVAIGVCPSSKEHADSWCLCGFSNSICMRLYNRIMQATSASHSKSRISTQSEYWTRPSPTKRTYEAETLRSDILPLK